MFSFSISVIRLWFRNSRYQDKLSGRHVYVALRISRVVVVGEGNLYCTVPAQCIVLCLPSLLYCACQVYFTVPAQCIHVLGIAVNPNWFKQQNHKHFPHMNYIFPKPQHRLHDAMYHIPGNWSNHPFCTECAEQYFKSQNPHGMFSSPT